MTESVFMQVDGRRDHSFRVPDPRLSVETGVPNACNGCHTEPSQGPGWAANHVTQWRQAARELKPDDRRNTFVAPPGFDVPRQREGRAAAGAVIARARRLLEGGGDQGAGDRDGNDRSD